MTAPDKNVVAKPLHERCEQMAAFLGDGHIATLLREAAAELSRMRTALEEIRDFVPDTSAEDAARDEAYRDSQACPACDRCRERNWPPSNLCDMHYRAVSNASADHKGTENMQHWSLREIARKALSNQCAAIAERALTAGSGK